MANKKTQIAKKLSAAFLAVLIVGTAVIFSAQTVRGADTNDGNISGGNGGGCAGNGGNTFDTCYGAVWHYYPLEYNGYYNAATDTITIPDTGSAKGGTLVGCGKYNSNGAGGYYRLALAKHNGDTRVEYNGGHQAGLLQVYKIYSPNGIYPGGEGVANSTNYHWPTGFAGDKDWSTAYRAFQLAEANGATNHAWRDVSAFCYSPEFEYKDTEGSVQSSSGVTVQSQGSDISFHSEESDKDGSVTLKISTNDETVNVDFFHKIHYSGIAKEAGSRDVYDNVPIKWSTEWGGNASGSASRGTFNTNGVASNTGKEASKTSNYTIHTKKGETVTYCQTISYNPKNIKMRGKPVTNSEGQVLYYHYSILSQSNNGSSKACIEITRPNMPPDDPEPNVYPGPYVSGGNGAEALYVGENTTVGWRARVKGVPSRRYAGYQTVNYLVRAGEPYIETIDDDVKMYRGSDVCSYVGTQRSYKCKEMASNYRADTRSDNSDVNETYVKEDYVITPDLVGDKYCNTMGYKFEYWYGVEKNGSVKWDKENGKDYWAIFGSVCRTIAKKPSVAVWNGSVITNEGVGIKGITSFRYTNGIYRDPGVLINGNRTKFGSWAEHLDVVGGQVSDFASGSTLALGNTCSDIRGCSPLTISNNTNLLGYSRIQRNSSYQNRLQSFLKSKARTGSSISADFSENTRETRIYRYSGDQTIDRNITYADGPYDSIYQLPQNIIFVDGNLSITSNVTRIDAWLIVDGKINTCKDFNNSTEADSQNQRRNFCTDQLAINGPVVANGGLELKRSYGSDPLLGTMNAFGTESSDRNSPAEIFNLRQDSYLWAYAQAGRYDSSYTESYSRELAPRY